MDSTGVSLLLIEGVSLPYMQVSACPYAGVSLQADIVNPVW
jgi:hypothetical protein